MVVPICLLLCTLVSIPDFTLLFLPNRLSYLSALAQPITKFHLALSFLLSTLLFLVDFGASLYFIQRDNFPSPEEAASLFIEDSHIVSDENNEGSLAASVLLDNGGKAIRELLAATIVNKTCGFNYPGITGLKGLLHVGVCPKVTSCDLDTI